jgi:hypothetical protein
MLYAQWPRLWITVFGNAFIKLLYTILYIYIINSFIYI